MPEDLRKPHGYRVDPCVPCLCAGPVVIPVCAGAQSPLQSTVGVTTTLCDLCLGSSSAEFETSLCLLSLLKISPKEADF